MRFVLTHPEEALVDDNEPTGQGPVATGIADLARQAAQEGSSGNAYEELKAAVRDAGPDERSAAAKELTEDAPAYETLHRALTEVGIEPAEWTP